MNFRLLLHRVRKWLADQMGEPVSTALCLLDVVSTVEEVEEVCEISGVGKIPELVLAPSAEEEEQRPAYRTGTTARSRRLSSSDVYPAGSLRLIRNC